MDAVVPAEVLAVAEQPHMVDHRRGGARPAAHAPALRNVGGVRREWADPLLRQAVATAPENSKLRLHARLALLPAEPESAGELADYLARCRPEELVTVREALSPHAETIAPALWEKATRGGVGGERLRAACALAGYAPGDARWEEIAPGLV